MAILTAGNDNVKFIVRRFPDSSKILEIGTHDAWLAAEIDFKKTIHEKWPVDTGLSRSGFRYQRTPRRKTGRGRDKGELIIYNNVWYARHVEKRTGVVKDAERELRRRNWGANYVPVIKQWRTKATVEKELRAFLKAGQAKGKATR